MRKVVITGVGALTPLGNNIDSTWKGLITGFSGIDYITRFDTSRLPYRIGGELKNFSPKDYIPKKDILRLDPFVHYAMAACLMAIEDAGIKLSKSKGLKTGVIIGSSRGGITTMEKALEGYLLKGRSFSAYLMSASTISMASSYISMKLGIKGPAIGISTACASGANAIGEAMRLIRYGEIDIALAGGTEAPICRLAVGGYGVAGALSKRNSEPQRASRPFDRGRDGFVIAEGACMLVLEELDHALKRNAKIYAELIGYGISSDAFHQTKPDSKGQALAIEMALKDAKISKDDVDYINAHATSTILGDIAETRAIRKVFGKRADDIPVSSCKSMLGHMLGATGALEVAITSISIHRGVITPTINLENPDPECGLNHVISTMSKEINIALSNSFGFGGVNAVLVLRKYRG